MADKVNYRGDTWPQLGDNPLKGYDALTAAHMFFNWLTGGKPTKIDPSVIFKDTQAFAPVENRAAAGRGINGLFGIGNLIGDIAPIEPIKPLNQSPMQPGVPYSVPPIPKPGGG